MYFQSISDERDALNAEFNLAFVDDFSYTPGNCLFDAIATFVPDKTGEQLRDEVISTILDDEQIQNIISDTLRENGFSNIAEYYVAMCNPTEWGTGIELAVLSRILRRPIALIHPEYVSVQENETHVDEDPIFLYYNNTHYQPLRILTDQTAQDVLRSLRGYQQRSVQCRAERGYN